MYIFKNALRCIGRSKGRNILIGIIVLVIAISACIGLSIRQAAENAKSDTLENMSVTATISFDRLSAMNNMAPPDAGGPPEQGGQRGEFDRSQFAQMMGGAALLTLDEYKTYAEADSVKDFYYISTVSVNGTDTLEPVSSEESSNTSETEQFPEGLGGFGSMGGKGGMMNRVMGAQSDFSLIGYSGENAMTAFTEGTASITDGEVFQEGTTEYECIISEELATYNSLIVGDSINISNPNNEEEIYTLTVCGIFSDTSANENSFSMMGMTSDDPANKIYMSYNALANILEASASVSVTATDENTGREFETGLKDTLSATYLFSDVESYESFEEEVRELGLDESYTVSSPDLTAFENSLAPLNTLSQTAGYFLAVILIIGAVILIVLNIFNVRERKYEIGVLTAMGMKKHKVALQFLTEIFVVTLTAVIIGAGIGAVSSVPVTNALLKSQVESAQTQAQNIEQNFGRGEIGAQRPSDIPNKAPDNKNFGDRISGFFGDTADYVTEINSATDMTVLLQMLGIAILLTVISGFASMLFIMRYEPLRILSNRD